ncbi:MAG: oxygen-independent coproporphyrinogen III oxidase [Bdellovibrionales bacterium]|nr:oxygen-independent coproporphyrinogen III oxidase [Bdellovibrionales bacterium]
MSVNLFDKYDIPAPRYTSYPTVPYWSDNPTSEQWVGFLKSNFAKDSTKWSLYLHIPFCETLCTFCGCNTSITKNHDRERPYVDLLLNEWRTYLEQVPQIRERTLAQFHLGGGTPTFLSAENLKFLVSEILKDVKIDKDFEGALEVDPRRTTAEQLQILHDLGFKRVSLGVQEFDPEVQRLVNRIQPVEMTQKITEVARSIGYTSVNYDLIYGLPSQTLEKAKRMIEWTCELKPDRIALYSLAVVPWIKPAQKLFKDEDLPKGKEKRKLYETSRDMLLKAGYVEIGMDHFALPNEALTIAYKAGRLHRNFMGYTDHRTQVLLGLGVSAISETPECFHQNEKTLPLYEKLVRDQKVATQRGHVLSADDRVQREQILKFMTEGFVELRAGQAQDIREYLKEMLADGLVEVSDHKMSITPQGKPFLRNAAMVLDQRLREKSPQTQVFSKAL